MTGRIARGLRKQRHAKPSGFLPICNRRSLESHKRCPKCLPKVKKVASEVGARSAGFAQIFAAAIDANFPRSFTTVEAWEGSHPEDSIFQNFRSRIARAFLIHRNARRKRIRGRWSRQQNKVSSKQNKVRLAVDWKSSAAVDGHSGKFFNGVTVWIGILGPAFIFM